MKTLFSLTIAFGITMSAFAQSVEAPQVAVDHFSEQLPETSVHWTQSNDQILGQFKDDGNPAGMRYEMDGTFVRKEVKVRVADLPQGLQNHLKENGVAESVVGAFRLETSNIRFLVNIGGTDHMFDDNGELMGTYNTEPFTW